MRLDARIPVLVLSRPAGPGMPEGLPAADALGVLVLVGGVADESSAEVGDGWGEGWGRGWGSDWAAVRRIPADGVAAPVRHAAGCACCAGRAPLALLLSELFRQRATGELMLFRRVVLMAPADAAAAAAGLLLDDPLVAGRYRPADDPQKIDCSGGIAC